ncbi:MAG: MBL fold metallo-hydrolase [Bacillaceae bacterium]|nr:MBL fold metallo-hydrolase [Bacillaceae bacterium]
MRFSILASGSTGNSFYLETDQTKILVDAGLSGKQIEAGLKKIGVAPSSLDALLVSHEHSDHIKGVGVLARRYDLPIYTNSATWDALDGQIGSLKEQQKCLLETGHVQDFGDLTVETFGISHDAAEPMGFCFYHGDKKISLVTDLGYVSKRIKDKVRDSHAYVFETNHDVEMLRMGSYPWNVKRRILSDVGHLSNELAGESLSEILKGQGEKVYLAHLSLDNNMTDLARLTVQNILEEAGFETGKDVKLYDTHPYEPTRMDTL